MISVIVPVYKVEQYLNACVESILRQSYRDFELILVDDGSPDRCGAMCDEWKKKDPRIRVIHQSNAGPSAARNAGIEQAKGDYFSFVDSDDWIAEDMLEILYTALSKNNADIACCNYILASSDGLKTPPPVQPGLCSPDEYWVRLFSGNRLYYVVPWNKLYKRELFSHCRYSYGKINEDDRILYDLLENCHRIAITNYEEYYYRQREDSIMSGKRSIKNLDLPEAYINTAKKALNTEKWYLAEEALSLACRILLKYEFGANGKQSAEYKSIKRRIRKLYREMLPHLSNRRKISILLFLLNEPLAHLLNQYFNKK